jgi:hypothetical protein
MAEYERPERWKGVVQPVSKGSRPSSCLRGDVPDAPSVLEPFVPVTGDETLIVLCFDDDDSAWTDEDMVNVPAMTAQLDIVDQIKVVRQPGEKGADQFLSDDALSVASELGVLASRRGSACERTYKPENRMQQESRDHSPSACAHYDAEEVHQMTPLLACQVRSTGSKNSQRGCSFRTSIDPASLPVPRNQSLRGKA